MPLSNDPLNRKWLDLTSTNPHLVNDFRPTLVTFMGWDRSKRAKAMGTGFLVGGDKHRAIVFTAKHVLHGARDFQRPVPLSATSALPEFRIERRVSIEPSDLQALWMGQEDPLMMKVVYVVYPEKLDIAFCVLISENPDKFSPAHLPLDLQTPSIGDTVHMVSCWQNKVSESVPPQKPDGFGHILNIERGVNIRIGNVTGVYEAGLRQYNFPCFTTSIPAEPGMSGGLVYLPKDGNTVAACGIVCGDNPTTEMEDKVRKSQLKSGESVIACTWPALGLTVPKGIPCDEAIPKKTFYDLIKAGEMIAYGDSLDQFDYRKLKGNDYFVQRKTQ